MLSLEQLANSEDDQIKAIANKSLKEVKYHTRFSAQWIKRLGGGTTESHQKIQTAINYLWPYTGELFEHTPLEIAIIDKGIGADSEKIKEQYLSKIKEVFDAVGLEISTSPYFHSGGKKGIHTEHFGFILTELQYMQRTYPNMNW